MRRNGMCDLMLTSTSWTTLSKLLNFSASVSYSVKRYNNPTYFGAMKIKRGEMYVNFLGNDSYYHQQCVKWA